MRDAVLQARLEQDERPAHVGVEEELGLVDRALDVTLRGEVDDDLRVLFREDRVDRGAVAYVALNEAEVLAPLERGEACAVAGVGQRVVADDAHPGAIRGEI